VIARRSVWSDPRVQELASRFIPAADEVGRLQRGDDAECLWFQKIAEQGHYAGRARPTSTRQGTYAAAPSGVLLASINNNDPRRMEGMLREALDKWESLPREQRLALDVPDDADPQKSRWMDRHYPADGLVLCVYSRDLPRAANWFEPASPPRCETPLTEEGATSADKDDPPRPRDERPWWRNWREHAWNQDFAWFRKAEARQWLPDNPSPGAEHAVPEALARRLARCHLFDNVRGQTIAYKDEDVRLATLTSRVRAIDGSRVSLRLSGRVRCETEGAWPVAGFDDRENPTPQSRSVAVRLLGRAEYDLAAERFTAFELVAVGVRWGGTQYNGRHDDLSPAPIGFVFTLAGDGPAERTPPAVLWEYGWR
jgi:hypothetical protein